MKRSHRVALKPTPEQEALFNQHAGYARFAYNRALGEFKAGLDVGEWLGERTLRPRWNRVKGMIAPWGSVLSRNAAKYVIMDLGQAAEGWGKYRRKVKDGPTIGVDVDVRTIATCSDGTAVANPKALDSAIKCLRRLDKGIARSRNVHGKTQHSNRREGLYAKRRRLHARVVNVRDAHNHKATTAIAKSAGRVVVETLNVAGMIRNRRLARAIADAGMSGFLTKLEYKCGWYGAAYVQADQWFASSKLCAHCGWKNDDLTLSDRE